MTDFVRDLPQEREPEQVPPVAAQAVEAARTVAAVPITDRRRMTAERSAAAAAWDAVSREEQRAPPDAAGAQDEPAVAAEHATRRDEPGASPPPGRERATGPAPRPDPGPERRAGLLAATITALARAPEQTDVDALLTSYAAAPAPEVEQAARTVTAVFLRAPAGLRRPLRAVLAPAVQRHRGTPLADRLAVRLAGGAVPPTAAAPGRSQAPAGDGRGTGPLR